MAQLNFSSVTMAKTISPKPCPHFQKVLFFAQRLLKLPLRQQASTYMAQPLLDKDEILPRFRL